MKQISNFSQFVTEVALESNDTAGGFYYESEEIRVLRRPALIAVPIYDVACQNRDGIFAEPTRMLNQVVESHITLNPPSVSQTLDHFLATYPNLRPDVQRFFQYPARYLRDLKKYLLSATTRNIVVPTDSLMTPVEIVKDVVMNPVRELQGFLWSLICTADNAEALFNVSRFAMMDPATGQQQTPLFIFSKATFNFIFSTLKMPAHRLAMLISAILGVAQALSGAPSSLLTTIASMMALTLDPSGPRPFSSRTAAMYNLSSIVTIRQVTRFILFGSIIAFSWKVGGLAWKGIQTLFHGLPHVTPHAGGLETVLLLVSGTMMTWLGQCYSRPLLLDFARNCSLVGGSGVILNTLTDCTTWVMSIVSRFLMWIGFEKMSSPINQILGRRSLESFTRRGGPFYELVPRINAFLTAKPIGTTGPGSNAFVEEGRSLVVQLDKVSSQLLAIEGAGPILATIARYRQQCVSAIENSLFTSENSFERCEPASFLFCGGPRMGKTTYVMSLLSSLREYLSLHVDSYEGFQRQAALLARENRWLYSRNSDDAFFSGYNKQAVIFYDDLLTANAATSKDAAAQRHEQEISEIQHLVSCQPYAPPMPEVGAGVTCPKGTYISPAWVIATSNFMFANTGPRSADIIDDRFHRVILVCHDPTRPKNASFGHLHFFELTCRLSEFRKVVETNGWTGNYSFDRKQFPYTINEMRAWSFARYFREVTHMDILDGLRQEHEKRIVEMMTRRDGVQSILAQNIADVDIPPLENSLAEVCAQLQLVPPNDFRQRFRGLGLVACLEACHTIAGGDRLKQDVAGEIEICLDHGALFVGSRTQEMKCACPGGHVTLNSCPHWRDLVYNFRFTLRQPTTSQVRTPCFMLTDQGDIELLRQPTRKEKDKWSVLSTMLIERLGHGLPMTRPPRMQAGLRSPMLDESILVGCRPAYRNVSGLGIHLAGNDYCSVFFSDNKTERVRLEDCFVVPQPQPHALLRRIERLCLFSRGIVNTPQFESQAKAAVFQELLRQTSDPTNDPDTTFVEMLTCSVRDPGYLPSQLLVTHNKWVRTHSELLIGVMNDCQPTDEQTRRIENFLDDFRTFAADDPTLSEFQWTYEQYRMLEVLVCSSVNMTTFLWRAWSFVFLTLCKTIESSNVPIHWAFIGPDGGRMIFPTTKMLKLVLYDPNRLQCEHVYNLAQDKITIWQLQRDFPHMSDKVVSDRIYPLVKYLVKLAGCEREQMSPLERLSAGAFHLLEVLRVHAREFMIGFALLGGAFLGTSLTYLLTNLVKRHPARINVSNKQVSGRNILETHNSVKEVTHGFSGNPNLWPAKYHSLLRTIRHNGERLPCKLCGQLITKLTHKHWDPRKQCEVVRQMVELNGIEKARPFLKAMYDFNATSLEALNQDDETKCRIMMNDAGLRSLVPWTATGMTQHFYVFVAYNCAIHRRRAIECLKKQQQQLTQYLGNRIVKPVYRDTSLVFPRSCEIEGEEIESCTYDVATCPHFELAEHAYNLPYQAASSRAVDESISFCASSMGFIMSDQYVVGRGAILADGVLFMPAHVIKNPSHPQILRWRGQTRFDVPISDANLAMIPEDDICLVHFDGDELASRKFDDLLTMTPPKPGSKVSIIKLTDNLEKVPVPTSVMAMRPASLNDNQILVDQHLAPGDSGSLVLQGGRIIGHYYGCYDKYGVISVWTKRMRKLVKEMARSNFFDSRPIIRVEDKYGAAIIDEYDTGAFDSNPPTELRKTELYDRLQAMGIESVKAPASLSQEALEKSISKWEHVDDTYDSDYLLAASELHANHTDWFLMNTGQLEPFSTWNECLNGRAQGEPRQLKKVDLSTSAGAPWCDLGIKKTALIDSSRDWLECTAEFEKVLDDCYGRLLDGDVAGYTATANSKDELRDLLRVAEKKTRLFCATPIHHNMLFRKYFGRWISAFKSMPFEQGMHAMGCDVYGHDWTGIYDYLNSAPAPAGQPQNTVFLAGDFSRFDTSHSGWKMRQAFKVASAAATDPQMCEALGLSISRFALRYGDREFRVPAGLPSGCQMTTPINCILNQLMWITAWRKLTGQGLDSFKRNCRLMVYGDDVVLAIDRQNPHFGKVTPDAIKRVFTELGYTLESADDKPLRWCGIDEITFLKRRFVKDARRPGVVHAPRPLDEVWTQLMWRRSEPNEEAQKCCFQMFAAEIGQFPEHEHEPIFRTLTEAVRGTPEYMKRAFLAANVRTVCHRAHEKQLTLDDLTRQRALFWKLW